MMQTETKHEISIVLASSNPGKLKEFQTLASDWRLEAQSAFGVEQPPEEGHSFIENALLKARFASRCTGLPAIGDDSGLEVFALNGAPGLFSARYAGCEGNDEINLHKVLKNLKGVEPEQRQARYICAMAYVRHAQDTTPILVMADWHGEITQTPIGSDGYGYDSIFFLQEQGCTVAQLPFDLKQKLSNRTRALEDLLTQVKKQRMMNL